MSTLDTHVFPIQARLAILAWLSWEEITGQKSGLEEGRKGAKGYHESGTHRCSGRDQQGQEGPVLLEGPEVPGKSSLLGLRGLTQISPGAHPWTWRTTQKPPPG